MFNPFPGLRPFEPDEDRLFFGREKEIDELLRRLRFSRFLSIIGTSGSGKSSLVRSGLIPSLFGGFMVNTSPAWRIAIMRPGDDPIRNLAVALNSQHVLGATDDLAATNSVLLEATLQRGSRGLVETIRHARIDDNLLIVVDQFEELFRFRRNSQLEGSRNAAVAFVKLLLEAAHQQELPIYIVITMRSDFIGDCMDFAGLPEAVNNGLYLVPRMTRDELRSAIVGPAAVGGGGITQRLVLRLLNDFCNEYDQLPILQHALMRTWDHWAARSPATDAMDIDDYEAIGTIRQALSIHAEEAYAEAGPDEAKKTTERIFKALTDTFTDHRGIRRPTSIADLTSIVQAPQAEIIRVVELFRRPGRSFLTPSTDVPLTDQTIIDLSHEALMRCWVRLAAWAEEERASADIYSRLSDAAAWWQEGRAGLWRSPELEIGQRWREENHPTAAWTQRYNSSFAAVTTFLDRSAEERDRLLAERKRERQRRLRQTQWAAGVLGVLCLFALFLAFFAHRQTLRAQNNLQLARKAVDESLSTVGSEQARESGDIPQVEQLRKQLLDKAQTFYTIFVQQNSSDPALRSDEARAHSRLGDINRLMGRDKQAVQQYTLAIAAYAALARQYPAQGEFRESLAYAHNWLGETLRDMLDRKPQVDANLAAQAENEYTQAIALQQALHQQQPANALYQQELARTFYNRGIVRYRTHDSAGMTSDFQQAIALLEPLVSQPQTTTDTSDHPGPAQDLARVYNNHAIAAGSAGQTAEAQEYYEKAIALAEQLAQKQPENREYKVELAQYYSNEATMLAATNQPALAEARSQSALALMQDLARPAPSFSIKMVHAFQLRGQLLRPQDRTQSKDLTDQAFNLLQKVDRNPTNGATPYSALYMNIGVNYLELAQDDLEHRNRADAKATLANVAEILPRLSPSDKQILTKPYQQLEAKLSTGPTRH